MLEITLPPFLQEVRMDDSPLEAGLLFTCKLKTDTDFLGRAALEKQRKIGARKKKICLTVDEWVFAINIFLLSSFNISSCYSDICLLGLEAIYRNGQIVGHVRRADHAYFLDQVRIAETLILRPFIIILLLWFQEVAYGYVSQPDGSKVTPSWIREGDYQVED